MENLLKNKYSRLLLVVVSGLLTAYSMKAMNAWLIWLALVPWFILFKKQGYK